MGDVTILLEHENRLVTITAMSLAQAKQKVGAAWPTLFEGGPEREVAAFEVIMTEIAENFEVERNASVGD